MPGAGSFTNRSVSYQQKWRSSRSCTLIIRLGRLSSADILGIYKIAQLLGGIITGNLNRDAWRGGGSIHSFSFHSKNNYWQ